MADHSVFSTAGRTPSAQMDPDFAHFTHRRRLPRLWTKVVGECVSAGQIDIVRSATCVDKDDKRMAIHRTADIAAEATTGAMPVVDD